MEVECKKTFPKEAGKTFFYVVVVTIDCVTLTMNCRRFTIDSVRPTGKTPDNIRLVS